MVIFIPNLSMCMIYMYISIWKLFFSVTMYMYAMSNNILLGILILLSGFVIKSDWWSKTPSPLVFKSLRHLVHSGSCTIHWVRKFTPLVKTQIILTYMYYVFNMQSKYSMQTLAWICSHQLKNCFEAMHKAGTVEHFYCNK